MKRNRISIVKSHFKKSLEKNGKYEIFSKKTGKTKLVKHYFKDSLNGQYIFFWDNGQVMLEGNFRNNKRIGEWLNYDINGEIIFKEFY